MKRLFALGGLVALLFASNAHGQAASSATVVSSCGTPPIVYVAGYAYAMTQNTNGQLCITAPGGGLATNATIVAPLGTQALAASVAVTDLSLQAGGAALTALQAGSFTYGSSFPATGNGIGLQALSAEPATTTTTDAVAPFATLTGKLVNQPYAPPETMVRGAANTTGASLTAIITNATTGVFVYVTAVQCFRTDAGTTASFVTFNDGASTVMGLPNSGGGGGNNMTFPVPLKGASATNFSFTSSGSISTVYCSAQGYLSKE